MHSALEIVDKNEIPTQAQDAAHVVRHLAHELRQPLSALESYASYLDIVLPRTDSKARQQIDKIHQLIQQTNWIIDDAVHYLQAAEPRTTAIDLEEVITQLVADRGRSRKLNLHLDLGAEPCIVAMDTKQAHHLVATMLNVFRQLAHSEEPVRLVTRRVEKEIDLSVSCVSPSIDAEGLRLMFEPFSLHAPSGSGLSLASARRIVEAHGGSAHIQSADGRIAIHVRLKTA